MQIEDGSTQSRSQGRKLPTRKNSCPPIAEILAPATIRREAVKGVFLDWIGNVARDRELPPSAALVDISLASFLSNSSCDEWPAISTLVEELGFSEATIRRSIKALRDRGHFFAEEPAR